MLNLSGLNLVHMERHERMREAVQNWLTKNPGKHQKDLAKLVGVKGASISQWTKGDTKNFRPENLFRFSDVTGYSARWLAIGDGQKLVAAPDVETSITIAPVSARATPQPISVLAETDDQRVVLDICKANPDLAADIRDYAEFELYKLERKQKRPRKATEAGASPPPKVQGRRSGEVKSGSKT